MARRKSRNLAAPKGAHTVHRTSVPTPTRHANSCPPLPCCFAYQRSPSSRTAKGAGGKARAGGPHARQRLYTSSYTGSTAAQLSGAARSPRGTLRTDVAQLRQQHSPAAAQHSRSPSRAPPAQPCPSRTALHLSVCQDVYVHSHCAETQSTTSGARPLNLRTVM